MKIIDQTKIFQEYKGQWAILDSGGTEVLSAGKELSKAVSRYHNANIETQAQNCKKYYFIFQVSAASREV